MAHNGLFNGFIMKYEAAQVCWYYNGRICLVVGEGENEASLSLPCGRQKHKRIHDIFACPYKRYMQNMAEIQNDRYDYEQFTKIEKILNLRIKSCAWAGLCSWLWL